MDNIKASLEFRKQHFIHTLGIRYGWADEQVEGIYNVYGIERTEEIIKEVIADAEQMRREGRDG